MLGTKTRGSQWMLPLYPFLRACIESTPVAGRRGGLVQRWLNVNKDLRTACKRAGISAVSPNDLRRSFASWLKQAGEDSLVVARLLGHSSTAMVERVYGHLGDDNYRRAVNKLPQATAPASRGVTPAAGIEPLIASSASPPADTKSSGNGAADAP